MFDEGRWNMQKDRKQLKQLVIDNESHRLHLLATPYAVWLYILALIPMILMVGLMFIDTEGVSLADASFTFKNFVYLLEPSIGIAFYNSIKFSFLTTVISLFFGYVIAYSLFKSKIKNKGGILLLLILPMWTNILLRIEALSNLMQPHNIITNLFGIEKGLDILGTDIAILIGLVFTYLPFVILPIYTALEKIDPSLEEAASDLGMTDTKKFWKVIFPLSAKGMVSGSIMVFLPCFSGFAVPKILGGGNILLIGNIIEQNFSNMNYNYGSILAVVILVIILGSILLINKFDKEGETLL